MKYMVVSSVIEGQHEAAVKEWNKSVELPEGVEGLGGWHVVLTTKAFTLWETDSLVSLAKAWTRWQDILSFEIYPVIDGDDVSTILE